MKQEILLGSTDRSFLVFIPDPASTDGSGKTGLAHTDITVSNTRVETDNDVIVTDYTSSLNALTNLTDAHNDWGWKEVSNTLCPGLYRIDPADALFASGAWSSVLYVMITTSAAAASPMEFILVATNHLDGVRNGLTALPNAAADAAGGLAISDAGGLDLDAKLANTNEVMAARMGALTDWINGGRLDLILDIIAADTTTDIPALLAAINGIVDDILVDTTDILVDTAEIGIAGAGLTNINLPNQTMDIIGNITGNLSGSVGSVTGAVGSLTANNDKTGYALSATGSAAMTEGYPALGATGTLPQLLYSILALLSERSIASTTLTTKKLDGATTAMTHTLDDANTPTSQTRAS